MATVQYKEATRVYPGTDRAAVSKLNLEIGDGELQQRHRLIGALPPLLYRVLPGLQRILSPSVDGGSYLDALHSQVFVAFLAVIFFHLSTRLYPRITTHLSSATSVPMFLFGNHFLLPHSSQEEHFSPWIVRVHTAKPKYEQLSLDPTSQQGRGQAEPGNPAEAAALSPPAPQDPATPPHVAVATMRSYRLTATSHTHQL